MELEGLVFFSLTFMMAAFGTSMAVSTHQLDWTTKTDFAKWVSAEDVQVGDNIYFTYNEKEHNVLQVSGQDYQSCNTKNPIATYNRGIDIVRITAPGDYYFICGHEGHCQAGQQPHVSIGQNPTIPTNPSNPRVPSTPSNPTSNPSPAVNNNGGGVECPPYYPYCNPYNYRPPEGGYPSSSSSLASKWLNNFGAWVGFFLVTYFSCFTM